MVGDHTEDGNADGAHTDSESQHQPRSKPDIVGQEPLPVNNRHGKSGNQRGSGYECENRDKKAA